MTGPNDDGYLNLTSTSTLHLHDHTPLSYIIYLLKSLSLSAEIHDTPGCLSVCLHPPESTHLRLIDKPLIRISSSDN